MTNSLFQLDSESDWRQILVNHNSRYECTPFSTIVVLNADMKHLNLDRRNYLPKHGIRVPFDELHGLLLRIFEKVNMTKRDADLLATILTRNNQRCIYSHGTGQLTHYLEELRAGKINPQPKVSVIREAPASLVLDGDGGLGYFPCWTGTEKIIEKSKKGGAAVLTTFNHHHFGSAGNYTRLAIEHDCIGIALSNSRNYLKPENSIANIINSSPISIAVPAGEEPPLVMDMGGSLLPFEEDLFLRLPKALLKNMALSAVIKALGGVLAGIFREEIIESRWESNQGSFIVIVNVAHFMPVDELKMEMDQFISDARKCRPLPGMDQAELAGGNEWYWEQENREKRIPLSDEHVNSLQEEAGQLGLMTSFGRYENTRF